MEIRSRVLWKCGECGESMLSLVEVLVSSLQECLLVELTLVVGQIGGGLMSDLWIPEERGKSLAVYALVPLLGSAVGAIAGGLVVQNTSWRNLFWGTSAFVACCLVCGFLFVHETFAPVIVRRKRAKYLTEVDAVTMPTTKTSKTLQSVFKDDLPRPFVLLATQPIIWALGLFMGYLWGLNFLMISTYQALWQDKYHQTSSNASLNYISISLGFIIGCEIVGPINDRVSLSECFPRITRLSA